MSKKVGKPYEIKIPESIHKTSWVILGLDLSLSRTGYAVFSYNPILKAETVIKIGSIKPKDSSNQVWTRSVGMIQFIRSILSESVGDYLDQDCGFIISCEMFTPRNDFLSTINRIMNAVLLGPDSVLYEKSVQNLYINAATLRHYMGLKQRGAGNKAENIRKAYEYVSKETYPKLNTDSCDAVLMAKVGIYAASILSEQMSQVPPQFQKMLCDSTQVVKGKGIRAKIKTLGLMHNPNYWFEQLTGVYEFSHQDATNKGRSETITYPI